MAVLLILVLLLIVLLWKHHSREEGKALTDSIPFMVNSETCTAVHAQHNEIYNNEAYQTADIAISMEPHTANGENAVYDGRVANQDDYEGYAEPCFKTTATADPTGVIETHGNEDYETAATVISTEPHTYYGENAAYAGRVDIQDDYEGYAEPCFKTTATVDPTDHLEIHINEAYQTTDTAHPTEHIETHGNEAYQTTATAISTQSNATDGGQVDYDDQNDWEVNAAYGGLVNDWEVNAAYGGLVDDQNVYEEIAANGGRVDNQDDEEYAEPCYQTTVTADPTEHIGTHGNEAYAAYGGRVDNPNDNEENAAYGGRIDDQFDCKENAAYGSRVGNQDDYEEDYVVPDYQ